MTVTQLFSFSQSREVTISDQTFIITEKSYAYSADKGVTMTLYKKSGEMKQKIFSFVLENELGNCSDKGIQEGAYEIEGSKITFYSHWRREGGAYKSPVGERIMVYTVNEQGMFQHVSSKVYIERVDRHYAPNSGMQYLFKDPVTKKEKAALAAYISEVEQLFKGTFVYGDEVKELKEAVHQAIQRKHQKRWH